MLKSLLLLVHRKTNVTESNGLKIQNGTSCSASASSSNAGGIHVTGNDNDVLELYGSYSASFNITPPIIVNKFTRLNFTIDAFDYLNTEVCFPETLSEACITEQCFTPDKVGSTDVDLGQILNGGNTKISFFTVTQKWNERDNDVPVSISGWTFWDGPNTDIIFENNTCKDPNAEPEPIGVQECLCKDGFVSSNGGKKQSISDKCVGCLFSRYCSFEGGYCSDEGDVVCGFGNESCANNRCEANVRSHVCIMLTRQSDLLLHLLSRYSTDIDAQSSAWRICL